MRLDKPASAVMPTVFSDSWDRRARRQITGINNTSPISKNIGSPIDGPDQRHGPRRCPRQGVIADGVDNLVGDPRIRQQICEHRAQCDQDAQAAAVLPNPSINDFSARR
jgi:hypothetical protein